MNQLLKHLYSPIVLVGALAFFPVLIWASMEPLSARFENNAAALKSVGQVSALAGTVLFSIGIILRTKLSFFSSDGIKTVGSTSEAVALLLLLTHPIVMIANLVSFSGWALGFGTYSLLMLVAYYGIRFCAGKNKYLKATPHVLGLVLFLGTLHAFFIPSDLSRNPLLQGYMLVVISSALASYLYQITLQRKVPKVSKLQNT